MSRENLNSLLKKLEHSLATGTEAAVPDHQLLERVRTARDQAAFHVIFSRHGPMVYRVCRRVLRDEQDVEDAFQATFLIFIRQAGSIRKLPSLASWLHGVAYQVSLRVRSNSQRRRVYEARLADRPEVATVEDRSWKEVRAILDEELARLPDELRAPIVLCYLEGLTQEEAALQLGQPKRTLQRRLQRGRERLGRRLAQRGLPAVGIMTLLSECVIAMPPVLASSAATLADAVLMGKSLSSLSHTLSTLTQEVITSMFPNRLNLKWIIVALFGLGLATVAIGSLLAEGQTPPTQGGLDSDGEKKDKSTVKDDKLSADGIAWGETVEGLKAGIGYRPGEEHSCRMFGSATFVVYLRNEGKTPISISHNENVFDEFLPSVAEESGKKIRVYPGPMLLGQVSRVDRTLEAGETIRLGYAWFLVKSMTWKGTAIGPTLLAADGKYLVSCAGFPLRRKGRDSDEMLWSTGSVELAIASEHGALKRFGVKAEVRGVLKYENRRVEGGGGYHILLSPPKKDDPEVRVWLNNLEPTEQDTIKRLLDKKVVVSGEMIEETTKSGAFPGHALYMEKFDIKEASDTSTSGNPSPVKDSANPKKEIKEEQEETSIDAAREFIRLNNFPAAERLLRKQLQTYPTGIEAPEARLLLGVCLQQLAGTPPSTRPDPAKAAELRNEALFLFRTVIKEVEAKSGNHDQRNARDALLHSQASLRYFQVVQQTSSHTDFLKASAPIMYQYRGTVEELIIMSLVYHGYRQQNDLPKANETRARMKELFVRLPPSLFTAKSGEYSREYWGKSYLFSGVSGQTSSGPPIRTRRKQGVFASMLLLSTTFWLLLAP